MVHAIKKWHVLSEHVPSTAAGSVLEAALRKQEAERCEKEIDHSSACESTYARGMSLCSTDFSGEDHGGPFGSDDDISGEFDIVGERSGAYDPSTDETVARFREYNRNFSRSSSFGGGAFGGGGARLFGFGPRRAVKKLPTNKGAVGGGLGSGSRGRDILNFLSSPATPGETIEFGSHKERLRGMLRGNDMTLDSVSDGSGARVLTFEHGPPPPAAPANQQVPNWTNGNWTNGTTRAGSHFNRADYYLAEPEHSRADLHSAGSSDAPAAVRTETIIQGSPDPEGGSFEQASSGTPLDPAGSSGSSGSRGVPRGTTGTTQEGPPSSSSRGVVQDVPGFRSDGTGCSGGSLSSQNSHEDVTGRVVE